MSGIQNILLGTGSGAAAAVDPFFYSVTSLLHGDGTNGAQNNTFLDSSTNNFTITRNGNTTQGSFSPFSQTGWGNYFDGSGDSLTLSSNAAFAPGTGDFTVEAWIFPTAAWGTWDGIFVVDVTGGIYFGKLDTGFGLRAYATANIVSTTAPDINKWTHVAVSRAGTTVRLFINGALVASATSSQNFGQGIAYIGNSPSPGEDFPGYISNLRLVKGTAVYTADFTVPTTPLTAITNTSLLTCQANRFLDASSNAFAITRNGDVSVQPFSPFNPTTAYSTSAVGGSGYFDGSGDYLSIANNSAFNLGTNNFCIEGWFYPTTSNATQLVFNKWGTVSDTQSMFQIGRISSTFYAQLKTTGGFVTLSTATWIPNAWNHFAVVRNGSTISAYLNGSRFGTDTSNPTLNSGTETMTIGSKQAQDYFTGYITDCRIVNGSAIYDPTQTSITVPTAPLTAVTNTAFLPANTNAGIFDNAAVADYETVGNAQISTSVKKYGTGSMSFDGTGDWLVAAPSANWDFGSGDFTIEMWINPSGTTAGEALVSKGNASSTGNEVWTLQWYGTNQLAFFTGSAGIGSPVVNTGSVFATGTWYHVAVCRVAGVTRIFVNGTVQGSSSASYTITAGGALYVGAGWFDPATRDIVGYIDDLRISKGVGRYPYNFTPPTAEFPNIGGTVTLTADPYYDYTTLLLPGNGTNGAQNNTFLDSSTNNFTITRNGNTTQGTFSPFSQTGWGNYFDGNGDYLQPTANSAFAFGTGNFTVECWIYVTDANDDGIYEGRSDGVTADGFTLTAFSSSVIRMYTSSALITASGLSYLNQWTHVALVCNAGTTTLYINGVSAGSTTTVTNCTNTNPVIGIGRYSASTAPTAASSLNGYISNFRVVKGTAVYTSNFTPSTTPLTAITNTSLLTCQSNRFIDNSTNAFAITVNGNTSIQAFSPFNPTAAWSAATYGGSGYFDGSGDYLQAGTNANLALGSGDFTIDGWHYCTGYNGGAALYSTINTYPSSTGLLFYIESAGKYTIDVNGTILQPAGAATLNAWVHWAVVRNGSTLSIYINGTSIGSVSSSTNFTDQYAVVGRTGAGANSNLWLGYLSGVRMVKGTAVYTGSFTPPTAPPTAISNTQFLLNYTNAGIYDATSKNDLETVGNAQISTTQSKFGGSSMAFDGTGDYLYGKNTRLVDIGSGDFTIEGWLYPTTSGTTRAIVSQFNTNGTGPGWTSYLKTTNVIEFYGGSGTITVTGTTAVSANAWSHFAICRYGSTITIYVNGVAGGTGTNSSFSDDTTGPVEVGARGGAGSIPFTGYIDDLRITKGIARYTSNFIPPTTAFLTL